METKTNFSDLITESPAMKEILEMAGRAALTEVNILLTGESGTGKSILCKAIHTASKRQAGPFIPVNCLAIPETLIESELFGHEKGAFTDAHASRKGSFETANGGTLYLDEIGDMTLSAQGKILQAIEESCFRRVGGDELVVFNARVIAATNRNLAGKIEEGLFREDLYYRLKEVCLHLPPLRERPEDIALLVRHFIGHFGEMYGKPGLKISDTAMNHLIHSAWPGNVRELANVVKSAVILCHQEMLWFEHFPFEISLKTEFQAASGNGGGDFSVENILKQHILRTLEYFHWNKRKTAEALRISRPRLDRYLKKYNLQREGE